MRAIYDKPIADIILNSAKSKAFPLRSGTRQECPLSPPLLSIVLKSQPEPLGKKKKKKKKVRKAIQIGKEDIKLSLFAGEIHRKL